jgi:hypothetical protein
MNRPLTTAEVAMVRAYARRTRIAFWVIAPLVGTTALLTLAIGMLSLWDHTWLQGGAFVFGSAMLGFALRMLWQSSSHFARVDTQTEVRRLSGLLEFRGGRGGQLHIGDTPVRFVSREVRKAVLLNEPCEAEAIFDYPILVVTAHPRKRHRA